MPTFAGFDAMKRGMHRALSAMTGGYDATDDRGRRRSPLRRTAHEDKVADEKKREILAANAHDLCRNFTVAKSMIETHLDYVSAFRFVGATDDRGYNRYLEDVWREELSTPERFDVAGRHSQADAMRITEACNVLEGDCGWLRLLPEKGDPDRGKREMIEGPRIFLPKDQVPKNSTSDNWVNGTYIDPSTGRALAYAISRRNKQGRMELVRIVPADHIPLYAHYGFRFDQIRGISAMADALNWLRDTYEAFDYAAAKLKIGQLFGLQIYSNTQEQLWARGDSDEEHNGYYEVDWKSRGPFLLELDQGDKAEVLQSRTQSGDDTAFLELLILICYKALKLPYSMWDASKGKFHGNKTELIGYQKSTAHRKDKSRRFQRRDAMWRLVAAIADGELELPRGKDLNFLRCDFLPAGIPPWDAAKEYRGSAMGIATALSNPYDECAWYDTDFEYNVDRIAQADEYARSKNVKLVYADSQSFAPEIVMNGSPSAQ